MKVFPLIAALVAAALIAGNAIAQMPTPTPQVTTVESFPSTPQYLRAFPGPAEDSWYVYASGFTPRTSWVLVEASCASLPCANFGAAFSELVKEDGTMSFYVLLPRIGDPPRERLLATMRQPISGGIPANAPSIKVAGHNPGGGLGYPAGTRTGIAQVDDVVALSQALNTAAIRSRLVLKDGTTTTGAPVRGLATWQCAPFVRAEENLNQMLEYPAGLVYAVFRVPNDPALPLRYHGAAYGIAWYDGGTGVPLGGLTLVSASGEILGTEIRCGTTPGYHVHNFTDFVLAPFQGPAPSTTTVTPGAPRTGDGRSTDEASAASEMIFLGLLLVGSAAVALAAATRVRR